MPEQQPSAEKLLHTLVLTLLPLQLFILTPITLYIGNIAEMNVGLAAVLQFSLLPALVSWLAIYGVYRALNERQRVFWLTLLTCTSLLVWVQSNLIVWDYGVLDGSNIDWEEFAWRGWIDLALWVFVLVAGTVLLRQRLKLLCTAAALIVGSQALSVTLNLVSVSADLAPRQQFDSQLDYARLHQLSSEQNVIHLTVDGFQADVFDFLMNEPTVGPVYRDVFSGFTFYKENMGVFPYTRFSVPAFLGGEIYKNNEKKDAYIDRVLGGNNILNEAKKQGFALDIASGDNYWVNRYASTHYDHIYNLDNDISINRAHKQAAMLIDISLFRSTPHFLKRHIYSQQDWLLSRLFTLSKGDSEWYFMHTRFLNSLIRRMETSRSEPVYKYFHVMNTHNPMVVDANCDYLGGTVSMTRETLTWQTKCTMDTLTALLERFKALGIYDSSLIVIQGDHGGWIGTYRQGADIEFPGGAKGPEWIKSLASPLLVIKPPHTNTTFTVSEQLTSLAQLPATIADIMGWNNDFGQVSIKADSSEQPETRQFYYYDWQRNAWETAYTGPIFEFTLSGSLYEGPWLPGEVHLPPQ